MIHHLYIKDKYMGEYFLTLLMDYVSVNIRGKFYLITDNVYDTRVT